MNHEQIAMMCDSYLTGLYKSRVWYDEEDTEFLNEIHSFLEKLREYRRMLNEQSSEAIRN